jgi:S1-C subfamily serine protease
MPALLAILSLFIFAALGAQVDSTGQARLGEIVATHTSALLRIKASADAPAADGQTPQTILRVGTGFFVSSQGLIITNASLVHEAKRLWYEADGVPYLAELKGVDASTNVALLEAKTLPRQFSSISLSDTVSLPAVGSTLLRLSIPMEFGVTPTTGIVQGADSQFSSRPFPTRYLRVQLTTGPGEAGSPIFDLQGRFVGMTVAALPEMGATYVLPARALAWVRDGLLSASGGALYGYFGFNAQEERSAADGLRLIVKNVENPGPAATAGLKVGDVITQAARKPVSGIGDLRDAAFYTRPGQYLDLQVQRGSQSLPLAIQASAK